MTIDSVYELFIYSYIFSSLLTFTVDM